MLFDLPNIHKLCEKYHDEPDVSVPLVVFVARSDKLAGERTYLEDLLAQAPTSKRADWIGRLSSDQDEQHLGAWFELMLFGWLHSVGDIAVEPVVSGNLPDFQIETPDGPVYIEARAMLRSPADRLRKKRIGEVLHVLRTISMPFLITVLTDNLLGKLDRNALRTQVITWLERNAHEVLVFSDQHGNRLGLKAEPISGSDYLAIMGPSSPSYINPNVLKQRLSQKAKQHKQLRKAGHPYVLAVWLEDPLFSPQEVIQAWLGNITVDVDLDTHQVIGQHVDRTGIHFGHNNIQHATVSGTLVFKAYYHPSLQRHELRAWYLQNPFAITPLAPVTFPVEASWIVAGKDANHVYMHWNPSVPSLAF
jgi:hypothetical protein